MISFPFGGPTGPTGDLFPDWTAETVTGAGVGTGLGTALVFMLVSLVLTSFIEVLPDEEVVVRVVAVVGVGGGVPLGLFCVLLISQHVM